MSNIKVSLVVPVYNTSRYLVECLESLCNQTLKDIEIICVNDGSTDASPQILDEYAERDSRIRVIHKANAGYGHTMNVGMAAARGKYVGIVESDDYVKLNMFQKLYEVAETTQVDFVKSDYCVFWGDGEARIVEKQALIGNEKLYGRVLYKDELVESCKGNIANCTGIYRRSFLKQASIWHNETPGASYQDLGFFFQVLINAESSYLLAESFYMYRQDNMSSSINNRGKIFCNCDEYQFIQGKLQQSEEKAKTYNPVFQWFRFAGLQYTFSRIGDEFRLEFLQRVCRDWDEAERKGQLDLSFFEPWEKDALLLMWKHPQEYYERKALFAKKVFDAVKDYSCITIYGAGVKGSAVLDALNCHMKDCSTLCFAVSRTDAEQKTKNGIPIKSIYELGEEERCGAVIVAVTDKYKAEMVNTLKELDFQNIITLDGVE